MQRLSGYHYLADGNLLAKAYKVTIQLKDVPLTYALDKIFEQQPLTYKITKNVIVIQEKDEKRVTSNVQLNPIDVKGIVANEKGEPMEGVTVLVKGTKKITVTNINGEFSLAKIDAEAVLVFSSVNMEPFEYGVSG
ncbi:MAG: carboxypeptidase-like regulatory domain-containing protein, partial [Chitinophagaceae bacterium]